MVKFISVFYGILPYAIGVPPPITAAQGHDLTLNVSKLVPGDMDHHSGSSKSIQDYINGVTILAECGVSHPSLRKSEEMSTAPLTLDTSVRDGSPYRLSDSRQHNYRYSEHADEHADTTCLSPTEPAESQCSTVIESCSLTDSCLTSPSPLPWSPLGKHPLESRCAPVNMLLLKMEPYNFRMVSAASCSVQAAHKQCTKMSGTKADVEDALRLCRS